MWPENHTMRQLALRIALIAALLTAGQEVRAQSQDPSDSSEYLLKAGFIYNFAKLVESARAVAEMSAPQRNPASS